MCFFYCHRLISALCGVCGPRWATLFRTVAAGYSRGTWRLRSGRNSLDALPAVPGGVARISASDRLNVPLDCTPGFSNPSKLRNPANPGSGRGTRREAPALGPSRAGAPLGKKRLSEDSPSGESGQSQHQQGPREGVPGA
ncbi:hypothetical protein NDU88_002406 [Pleurodeles waltl]|uniref:Uncharacterized protein n=1 Tax=Pleurodeles waltl TaxID=8319 RepID=A0AAV7TMI5_PLEWA|nr:hypothetical protein NDU88_002406 [Pleurodeles waltl]